MIHYHDSKENIAENTGHVLGTSKSNLNSEYKSIQFLAGETVFAD
tara:strand:+ start:162 stop:296 length:135 start_codon:yes stop_codon:yes gene_type:complete